MWRQIVRRLASTPLRGRRWGRRAACGLLLAALLVAMTGCSTRLVRRSVEKRIARRLESLLGPAESYRVRVYGTKDAELVSGRAQRIVIEGRRVLAAGVLPVESIWGELRRIRYEGGEADLLRIEESDIEVEFSQEGLNAYLQENHARYQPQLRVDDGRVSASIIYRLAGVPTPITAVGRLEVIDHRQLVFRAEQVDTVLLNHPDFTEDFVERRINPIVDLGGLDWPVRLDTVRVEQGRILVHGSATIHRRLED